MINCPACGAVNDENNLDCSACGRRLFVICDQCKTKNLASNVLCSFCGRKLIDLKYLYNKIQAYKKITQQIEPYPPFIAWLKLVVGVFIFVIILKVQPFGGSYSIASMFLALLTALIILYGCIDLYVWYEKQKKYQKLLDEQEKIEIPEIINEQIAVVDKSFEELDKEMQLVASMISGTVEAPTSVFVTSKQNKSNDKNQSATCETKNNVYIENNQNQVPNDLVSSIESKQISTEHSLLKSELSVQGNFNSSNLTNSVNQNETNITQPLEQSITDEKVDFEGTGSSDDLYENRKRKATTLLEFLNEGIQIEIENTSKKLAKSPKDFSLNIKLAMLYEEQGDIEKTLSILSSLYLQKVDNPEFYLYYGTILKKANKLDEAKEILLVAINKNNNLEKAFFQLGCIERRQNNFQKAKEYFQKCIQLSPDDPYAHYQLGMVYKEMGAFEHAEAELKRAITLHPYDSYGHSQLGHLYFLIKKFDKAIYEYSQALSLKPNDPYVLEKLGDVLSKKGELEKAKTVYQEALAQQFSQDENLMLKLANIYYKLGDFVELNKILQEILRLAPNNCDALFYLGMCYKHNNDIEQAMKTLEDLTDKYPNKSEAWLELAKIYQSLNLNDYAIRAYVKASANADDQASIWNTIGVLFYKSKNYQEAIKAFKKAASFDYTDPQIQKNLKSAQQKLDEICKNNIDKIQAELKKNPKQIELYLKIAENYEKLEQLENALIVYQQLLTLEPCNIEGLLKYANIMRRNGNLKIAIRCYKEILKLDPNNMQARIELIKSNLNLGFVSEALKQAQIAQKQDPNNIIIHFLLGKIYFLKGLLPRSYKEFLYVAQNANDPDIVSWAELMRRRIKSQIS